MRYCITALPSVSLAIVSPYVRYSHAAGELENQDFATRLLASAKVKTKNRRGGPGRALAFSPFRV